MTFSATRRLFGAGVAGFAAYISFAPCVTVLAQTKSDEFVRTEADKNLTAVDRPEYKPAGIELDGLLGALGLMDKKTVEDKSSAASSFLVFPKFAISSRYDSNLFREESDEEGDVVTIIDPSLAIRSDWSNHSAFFEANGSIGFHASNSSENFNDFRIRVGGHLDVTSADKIASDVEHRQGHEARGDPDDPGSGVTPVVFHDTALRFNGQHKEAAVGGRLDLEARRTDFDDSGSVDNDVRDRWSYLIKLRVGYEFSPGFIVFVEPRGNARIYNQRRDRFGFLQDSHGYQILAGGRYELTGVTVAELAAGYLVHEPDEPSFSTVRGASFSGSLTWNPTDLVTVKARLSRMVEETQQLGVSGILTTKVALGVEYAPLDNLIITPKVDYTNSEFRGTDRTDNTVKASLFTEYLITRNWFAKVGGGYGNRNSSRTGGSFANLFATVQVGAQL